MISKRAEAIKPSATLTIAALIKSLKAEGRDVIGLSSGEPDFVTPDYICDAAADAIRSGKTHYTPGQGTLELRSAICSHIQETRGRTYEPANVIVSSGAKQSIANIVLATADNGDEVIMPAPYWVSYAEMATIAGAKAVVIQTTEEDGFLLTPGALEKSLTSKSRVLILNTPSNPTGCLYPRERIEELYAVLDGTDVVVISDEIYSSLIYGDAVHFSPLSLSDEAAARTVLVDGVSKKYAMTGWRVGFAAGPPDIIKACSKIQGHTTSCASSISQAAALAAYKTDDPSVEEMRKSFDERRKYMVDVLSSIEGVSCREPMGAFYCFPNVSAYYGKKWGGQEATDSTSFCEILLKVAGVGLVPGGAFGADEFVRISYAASIEEIKSALDRLKGFLREAE